MKKLLSMLLALVLLAGCMPALAEESIPADILAYFSGRVDSTITNYVHPDGSDVAYVTTQTAVFCFQRENGVWSCQWATNLGTEGGLDDMPAGIAAYVNRKAWTDAYIAMSFVRPDGGDAAFVAAAGMDGVNRLFCFRLRDGQWKLQWSSKAPMPQENKFVSLVDISGMTWNGRSFDTAFLLRDCTVTGWDYLYELSGSTWRLRMITGRDTDNTILETYLVENGVVKYEGWKKEGQQRIYGVLQNDLRYFSCQDFPAHPDDLRSIMSNPPSIPEGTLSAQRVQFTGGRKYNVYNGPGEAYGQSGDGNAHVSTNDWIQVFGEQDGWILIQYDVTRTHMRIGWITADALPDGVTVPRLTLTPIPAYVTTGVSITDDPLGEQAAIAYVREGVTVQWLATMGEWAYIESTDGSLVRGFIPLSRLTTGEWEK